VTAEHIFHDAWQRDLIGFESGAKCNLLFLATNSDLISSLPVASPGPELPYRLSALISPPSPPKSSNFPPQIALSFQIAPLIVQRMQLAGNDSQIYFSVLFALVFDVHDVIPKLPFGIGPQYVLPREERNISQSPARKKSNSVSDIASVSANQLIPEPPNFATIFLLDFISGWNKYQN